MTFYLLGEKCDIFKYKTDDVGFPSDHQQIIENNIYINCCVSKQGPARVTLFARYN